MPRKRKPIKYRLSLPTMGSEEAAFWARAREGQLYHEMKPRAFTMLAAGRKDIKEEMPEWEEYSEYRALCNRIRTSQPLDPPRLVVRADDCKVLAHEGRHRSSLAAKCRVQKIPVILTCVRKALGAPYNVTVTKAENCLRCVGKGFKPQRDWSTQDVIYYIHRR